MTRAYFSVQRTIKIWPVFREYSRVRPPAETSFIKQLWSTGVFVNDIFENLTCFQANRLAASTGMHQISQARSARSLSKWRRRLSP